MNIICPHMEYEAINYNWGTLIGSSWEWNGMCEERMEETMRYAIVAKAINILRTNNTWLGTLPKIYEDSDGSLKKMETLDNGYLWGDMSTCMQDPDANRKMSWWKAITKVIMIQVFISIYELVSGWAYAGLSKGRTMDVFHKNYVEGCKILPKKKVWWRQLNMKQGQM